MNISKNKNYWLIYLDILGFENLAKEISEVSKSCRVQLYPEEIRGILIKRMQSKIDTLQTIKEVEKSSRVSLDSWLLHANNFIKVFFIIHEILQSKLPVEIAVDKKIFKRCPTNNDLVNLTDEVIDFLKSYIINGYHKFYENEFGRSVTDSFILFTKDAYNELYDFDKKLKESCGEIHYEKYVFYNISLDIFENKIKILRFLKKIGQSINDYSGAFIDRIFIPPNEYEEIRRKLKDNRLVFITGPLGIGKTYVAIRLLWEWYTKGYTPIWIAGKDELTRRDARDKLIDIQNLLRKKLIIYFEDIFGKVKYENREDLESRITGIIDYIVKNKQDSFVIITLREDLFEQFEKRSLAEEIRNFKVSLDITKSYNYKQKRTILEKWAEEKGCRWLKNNSSKQIVLKYLKEKDVLPTPLSIYEFVLTSINIDNKAQLIQLINKYSKHVERVIAGEIITLYERRRDRFLLLSFIFVSQRLSVNFVKRIYNEMKKQNFKDFNELLKEEYRLKIETDQRGSKILTFVHPIYTNALPFILNHNGCRNTFFSVVEELANRGSMVGDIIWTIMKHYNYTPKNIKDLIFRFAFNDYFAPHVSVALLWNFDKLLTQDRDNLLLLLAEKNGTSEYLVWTIVEHLDEISTDVLNEIFSKLYKQRELVDIAIAFNADFNRSIEILKKLRNDIRLNILKSLAEQEESAFFVARILSTNSLSLSDEDKNILISVLQSREDCTNSVIGIIKEFIECLPQDLQCFLNLSGFKRYAVAYVIWSIVREYSSNDNLREFLLKLATNEETMKDVIEAIAFYYPSLSAELQSILSYNNRIKEKLKIVIESLSESDKPHFKHEAMDIILNTKTILPRDFCVTILDKLVSDTKKDIKDRAEIILNRIL